MSNWSEAAVNDEMRRNGFEPTTEAERQAALRRMKKRGVVIVNPKPLKPKSKDREYNDQEPVWSMK